MKRLLLFLFFSSTFFCAQAQKKVEEKLDMALYAVTNMYVDSIQAAPLIDSQIAELLSKLDPFSEYLPPVQANNNEQVLGGHTSYIGIGIEGSSVDAHFYISFVEPVSDAYAKGLRAGDEIISIDNEAVSNIAPENIAPKLSGIEKSTVNLVIKHPDGKITNCNIVRNYILSSSIRTAYMLNKQTGYISISMFSESTVNDFKKAIVALQVQGMKNLILDIQKNGGGLFDQAVALADELLEGSKVIVHTRGAHVPSETFSTKNKGCFENGKLVVLISNQTKSAAEIFAGAMQDWDRAVLIGSTTFGKGLIQQTLPFEDGSALRLTVARYYTPSGRTIQKPYNGRDYIDSGKVYYSLQNHRQLRNIGGISPDIEVLPDTIAFSPWYNMITYSGVQKVVARNYTIRNRSNLKNKYKSIDAFIKAFDSNELLAKVKEVSDKANITFNQSDFERSKEYLKVQLKALVARDLYNNNDYYYRLINTSNSSIKEAEKILNVSNNYHQILNDKK